MTRSLLFILLFVTVQLSAQRLENIRAEAVSGGEKVIITYDLTGGSQDQKYKVTVFGSHNNYSQSLSLISGDVNDVTPGTNKKIEWNAKNEMVDYTGDITFELRADVIVAALPPLSVYTPAAGKKGKSLTVHWDGTVPGESVKLDLVKGGIVVAAIGTTHGDARSYNWTVPKDTEKGADYQIRLSTGARAANSGSFPIKKKTSPLLIIIPAAVVVGVVVLIAAKPKKAKDLPTPPDPE